MERNTYQRNTPPTGIFCYTTPMYDRNDRRINVIKTAGNDFYRGRSTWLRIDRAGRQAHDRGQSRWQAVD